MSTQPIPSRRLVHPALLLVFAALALAPPAAGDEPVILLVRHAEKTGEHGNVDLSAEGLDRAAALADLVAGPEGSADSPAAEPAEPAYGRPAAIFVTELCRTAQTAAPAARRLGLPLTVQAMPGGDLTGCTPPVGELEQERVVLPGAAAVVAALAERAAGSDGGDGGDGGGATVLLAGHSNTVPAFAEALTGVSLCPDPFPLDDRGRCLIPNDDYHHLFVLRPAEGGADGAAGWRLEHASYGAPSGTALPAPAAAVGASSTSGR